MRIDSLALLALSLGLLNSAQGADDKKPPEPKAKTELNALNLQLNGLKALATLELDADLSETQYALGILRHFFEWDWDGAQAAYIRALELSPQNAVARNWYAYLCVRIDVEQALELSSKAIELEPFSPYILATAGWVAHLARRHELAAKRLDRALELDPSHLLSLWMRALVGLFLSEATETLERLKKVEAIVGHVPFYATFLGIAYAAVGQMDKAREVAAE